MQTHTLELLFRTANGGRDNFLSRLFGIFNEDIVRIWCNDARSPYDNVGRPTIRSVMGGKGYTLDFALKERATERIFVSEMKCELAYDGYKYLVLSASHQVEHHKGAAFKVFLDTLKYPDNYKITINGKPQKTSGAILVWGHCTDEGRNSASTVYGFHTVLSLQDMINDLREWQNDTYMGFLGERQAWCNQLFNGLRDKNTAI